MKIVHFFLLILIICLLLAPYNNSNIEAKIIGEWISLDGNDTLIFNEDGTLICSNGIQMQWGYNQHRNQYYITYYSEDIYFSLESINGINSFEIDAQPYYHINDNTYFS